MLFLFLTFIPFILSVYLPIYIQGFFEKCLCTTETYAQVNVMAKLFTIWTRQGVKTNTLRRLNNNLKCALNKH